MKFGKKVEQNSIPEWATQYMNYKMLKKQLSNIVRNVKAPITRSEPLVKQFEELLVQEMNKVNEFYILKEKEASNFFKELKSHTAHMEPIKKKKRQKAIQETDKKSDTQSLLADSPVLESVEISEKLSEFSSDAPDLAGAPNLEILDISSDLENSHADLIIADGADQPKSRDPEENSAKFQKFLVFLQNTENEFVKKLQISEVILTDLAHKFLDQKNKHYGKIMRSATMEYYRGLVLLKNYRVLNYTGFVKILKKAEKLTRIRFKNVYLPVIAAQQFNTSTEVDWLLEAAEGMYATYFCEDNIRDAKRELRIPEKSTSHWTSFTNGLFVGLIISLVVVIVHFLASNKLSKFPRLQDVYTMFSALGLPILWAWVFGLDVLVWTKTHIHYSFIFEIDPRFELSHHHFFEIVTMLTLIWLSGIGLYMWMAVGGFPIEALAPEMIPLVLALLFGFLLFCPFNIFHKEGRYWFLSTIFRIVIAPFKSVKFKDFFIADQLTSMVLVLVQLQFLLCFYSVDAWQDESNAVCWKLNPKISPCLSYLPAYWRFMQCLRRYKDSRDRVHLYNACKYSCTFFVVTFSTLDSNFGTGGWGAFRICWAIAATVNALYAYTWDMIMDWGLVKPSRHGIRIRTNRMYSRGWVYVWAAVTNFFLRFTWSLTKSNLVQLSHILQFRELSVVIAASEILRRGQWNLFRMENEHLNNCGKFRAVQEISLPVYRS